MIRTALPCSTIRIRSTGWLRWPDAKERSCGGDRDEWPRCIGQYAARCWRSSIAGIAKLADDRPVPGRDQSAARHFLPGAGAGRRALRHRPIVVGCRIVDLLAGAVLRLVRAVCAAPGAPLSRRACGADW